MTVDWGRHELELAEARLVGVLVAAVVRDARRRVLRRRVLGAVAAAVLAVAVQRARRPSPSQ